jgi:hypothetical protein
VVRKEEVKILFGRLNPTPQQWLLCAHRLCTKFPLLFSRRGGNFPDEVGKLTGWLKAYKVILNLFYRLLEPPPPRITDEKSAILGYSSLKKGGEIAQDKLVGVGLRSFPNYTIMLFSK